MRPTLAIWPGREISSYKMMLWLGTCLGIYAGALAAQDRRLAPGRFVVAVLLLLAAALLGARSLYVLEHREVFHRRRGLVWRRDLGGASLYGGLLAAVALSAPLTAALSLPFGAFWDCAALTMATAMSFTKLGCLLHGCCAGCPSESPLALSLRDAHGQRCRRQPVQLYEALLAAGLALVGGFALHVPAPPGTWFLIVLAGYSAGRIPLQRLRADPAGVPLALASATCLLALGLLIVEVT